MIVKYQCCEWCGVPATRIFHADKRGHQISYKSDRFSCENEEHREQVKKLLKLDGFDIWVEHVSQEPWVLT